jgi:hypothetical protein
MVASEELTAMCVQRFDDSRNSAIHTTYRISLRSSSLREPRYPLLRVISDFVASPRGRPASTAFTSGDCLSGGKEKGPAKGRPAVPRRCRGWGGGSPMANAAASAFAQGALRRRLAARRSDGRGRCPDDSEVRGGVQGGARVDRMVSMILPQVHLRKPCYDFSFL